MALSISTGLFCGIWALLAENIGIASWLGFVTCTTYFACGEKNLKGVIKALSLNFSGMICALIVIKLNTNIPFTGSTLIYTGFFTFIMCIIAKKEMLNFIPGTFMGSFSTFAANGNFKMIIPAFLIGGLLGLICDRGGIWLHDISMKKEID